jgi:hypothetical protein
MSPQQPEHDPPEPAPPRAAAADAAAECLLPPVSDVAKKGDIVIFRR